MDIKGAAFDADQTNTPTDHDAESTVPECSPLERQGIASQTGGEMTEAPQHGKLPSLVDWVSNYMDLLATELYHKKLGYQERAPGEDQPYRMPQLNNCCLEEFSSDHFGKTIVRFSTKNHDGFAKGDPVSVRNDDIGGAGLMHGIVHSLGDNSVEVYLNQACGYLDEDGSYSIIKVEDDTTDCRMRAALHNLPQLEHPLVKLLFGDGQPTQQPLEPASIKFFNESLTDDQKEAVVFSLSANELAVIHGPPGTGKTTTLVEVILQLTRMGKKVLACAPTNVAVDNLLGALVRHERLRVVRMGHPARSGLRGCLLDTALAGHAEVASLRREQRRMEARLTRSGGRTNDALLRDVRQHRGLLREQERMATRDILRSSDVVACTLLSACAAVLEGLGQGHFDVVIIDENSQAMEAASWVAVPWGGKVILAGDPMQLPPTVRSPSPCDLEVSLMERAVSVLGERCQRTLSVQHRMNSDIMRWVSGAAYEGRLSAHPAVADQLLCHLDGVQLSEETETPLLLVDTAGCRLAEEGVMSSQQNLGEARVVVEVVERLLAAGVPQQAIGVITPYKQQVWLMKRELRTVGPAVEVHTVDGYQGREKEAVVLSMVRSNQDQQLGFTADKRRLTVAVSRAQRLLCVVADTSTLSACELYRSLFAHVRTHGIVHNAHQYDCVIPQHGQTSSKSSDRNRRAPAAGKGEATARDAEVETHLEVLRQFVDDRGATVCRFPRELSSYTRMQLHSECERLGLKHYSEGVADQRHLVVEKLPGASSGNDLGRELVEDQGPGSPKNVDAPEDHCVRLKVDEVGPHLKDSPHENDCEGIEVTDDGPHDEVGDPSEPRYGDPSGPQHGDSSGPRHGDPLGPRHGDQLEPRHGDPSEPRHGDSSGSRHGDPLGPRHGDQLEPRHGDPSEPRHGDSSGSRHGDPSEPRHGDSSGSRHGDPSGPRHGDQLEPRHGDPSGPRHSDLKVERPGGPAGGNVVKPASNPKRRHRREDRQEETDDEVLHRFQQDGRTCGQDGCGKSTELFGQLCQHCRRSYCLGHCLPEVHGCTEEARAQARATFLRPLPRPADPVKRGFAERKLKAKLGDMAQKRKPKKK